MGWALNRLDRFVYPSLIMDTIGGGRSLHDIFKRKHVYADDYCVEYNCLELKDHNDMGKIFFIFSQFSSKGLIKLYAIVD